METEPKKELKVKDLFILEQANVMAIVPNKEQVEDTFNIDDIGFFKSWVNPDLDIKTDISKLPDLNKIEKIKISNSTYSVEFIQKAIKTAKAFLGKVDMRVFLMYDKEENKFLEDNPCLLVFDNMVFILAPRVETEEE